MIFNPKREKSKNFCKKFFDFSLKRPRLRGLFREKKKFFLQKNFFFSLFGYKSYYDNFLSFNLSATEGILEYALSCAENGVAQNGAFRLLRGINLFHLDLELLPFGLYEVRLTFEGETEIIQVKKVKKSKISALPPMVEKK